MYKNFLADFFYLYTLINAVSSFVSHIDYKILQFSETRMDGSKKYWEAAEEQFQELLTAKKESMCK